MPWTEQRYPASMRHLPSAVRQKAIEIANALLADGHAEGQAIRIAIAAAKRWAAHRGWPVAAGEPAGGGVERAARHGPRARQPPSARQPGAAPRRDQR
jgi:uncharacterized protein YoaH (UPF0181 family)